MSIRPLTDAIGQLPPSVLWSREQDSGLEVGTVLGQRQESERQEPRGPGPRRARRGLGAPCSPLGMEGGETGGARKSAVQSCWWFTPRPAFVPVPGRKPLNPRDSHWR